MVSCPWCLTKQHAMQMYEGMGAELHTFLISALDGSGELHASAPFFPRKIPGTHWVGGWVGPRAGMGVGAKIINLPCWESNPGRPARSLVTIPTDLCPFLNDEGCQQSFTTSL
jgi:hypothetical protein